MDAATLVLPINILAATLAIFTGVIAIAFQLRKERLPAATRLDNIWNRVEEAQRRLQDKEAELSAVEQKIHQRDRLIAEVASLEERRNVINAELESLASARAEIEEVKAEAADVAARRALEVQELERVTQELQERRKELAGYSSENAQELRREVERLEQARESLGSEMEALRRERDVALERIQEAARLEAAIQNLELRRDNLLQEMGIMDDARAELRALEESLMLRRVEANALAEDVRRLEAARARLEDELRGTEDGKAPDETLIADLVTRPACLGTPALLRKTPREEDEALHSVEIYLKELGLEYSPRTLRAFHTALKINDNSQLTVLAGVSGTGKSLLPRRYAEAMGIHFLQIAVEPRWDSPQDLLGFYNYIEKRYRATELARLLAHMDPYSSLVDKTGENDPSEHMALVLLDEMNLARVEYYFSEFLSRLEVRPRFTEEADSTKRGDALIPVDIRGLRRPVSLYPSHNVLFAGTMNDDESTQALSDKVLDRANILQFAAPKEFRKPGAAKLASRPGEAQSFKSWRTWVRPFDALPAAARDTADEVVRDLADLMENCGRPFGHRLRDSILAYVGSYPYRGNGSPDVTIALADQIEYRILPKLRGLELDSHRHAFEQLDQLIRGRLGDSQFADRLGELCGRQASGTGPFVWRGLNRES